jgi:nucleoside-diphosphate-sugar epimerase
MKYFITGGAGFIGCNTARRLVREGNEVTVFDNLSTGRIGNLDDIKDSIRFIQGDIRKPQDLAGVLAGMDAVIHLAAFPAVVRSMKQPVEVTENNVMGTLNVLMAAKDTGVRRIVFASSSSVYGDSEDPIQRESQPLRPKSPYAASKLACEHYMHVFAKSFGIETVSLRYFNVFGPFQDPKAEYAAVIPIFMRMLMAGEKPVINGDGEQTRDFAYVENVVEANICASTAPAMASGMAFNVAGGESVSINKLYNMIREGLGRQDVEPVYGPPQPGDVRGTFADLSLAKKYLGYVPRFTFAEGLDRTLAWYKKQLG